MSKNMYIPQKCGSMSFFGWLVSSKWLVYTRLEVVVSKRSSATISNINSLLSSDKPHSHGTI